MAPMPRRAPGGSRPPPPRSAPAPAAGGEAGLGLEAEVGGFGVRNLRLREVALEAVDLALAVAGISRVGPACGAAGQPFVGATGLLERRPTRPSSRISARCTRQTPVCATMSGCSSHQRVRASVHSRARRSS